MNVFVARLKDKITYKFNTLQGRNNYSVLKSLGDAKLVNLLVECLGLDWKRAYTIEQAALVSIPPHTLTSPSLILNMFCFFTVALGFLITLTFASNRIKTYIEKAVIISEKWVLKIFSQAKYIYNIFRLSELCGQHCRIQHNLYLQWLCLVVSPWSSSIKKNLLLLCICPILCNCIHSVYIVV